MLLVLPHLIWDNKQGLQTIPWHLFIPTCGTRRVECTVLSKHIPPIWHVQTKPFSFPYCSVKQGFPLSPCTSHALQLWRPSVMCDVTSGFCPLLAVYCLLTSTMRLCSALACCQEQPHDGSQQLFYLSSPPIVTLALSSCLSFLSLSLFVVWWINLYLLKGRLHTEVTRPGSNAVSK